MEANDVERILQQAFENCDVSVASDGGHVNILLVGDVFDGLNRVKRQQLVYAALNEHIVSGELHAVNMKTFTSEEYQT
ncbi:MAG: BolA/IbaG family iron-sulfur metabolism protein [Pseudomonadota bacterium]